MINKSNQSTTTKQAHSTAKPQNLQNPQSLQNKQNQQSPQANHTRQNLILLTILLAVFVVPSSISGTAIALEFIAQSFSVLHILSPLSPKARKSPSTQARKAKPPLVRFCNGWLIASISALRLSRLFGVLLPIGLVRGNALS